MKPVYYVFIAAFLIIAALITALIAGKITIEAFTAAVATSGSFIAGVYVFYSKSENDKK